MSDNSKNNLGGEIMGKEKYFEHYGFPPQLSKEELTKIYDGHSPRADNLLNKHKRIRLKRFTGPFKGDGRKVAAKFGRNLDTPLNRCFEEQLDKFVNAILDIHWNKEVPITGGMIRVLKRMGRAGVLYRHGFNPKSPEQTIEERLEKIKQLESEIERDQIILGKKLQFEEERDIKRQEALGRFYNLPQEDQYRLRQEYDYAKTDPRILIRGGQFEDFLIREFKIKINLFDKISKTHNIRIRLGEISADLKGIIQKRKKDEIESTEFIEAYNPYKELNDLDQRLCELQTSSR
jgi:hypothetical protein